MILIAMALPFAAGAALATFILWPIAHRAGQRAERRDQAEIARILGGYDAPPVVRQAIEWRPSVTAAAANAPTASHASLRVATTPKGYRGRHTGGAGAGAREGGGHVHRAAEGDGGMTPYYADDTVTLYHGDALAVLEKLPDESVDCCVTSPPYYALRDYGQPGQYGLEPTLPAYVETMRAVFAEAGRVLTTDGTLWLNLGDSYAAGPGQGNVGTSSTIEGGGRPSFRRRDGAAVNAPRRTALGLPAKNLLGVPWRVAFALQDDGWILRNAIVWHKPNGMPASVTDRLSNRYEQVFLFSRAGRYWFDLDPIRQPHDPVSLARAGRNRFAVDRSQAGVGSPHTADPREACNPLGRNLGDVWEISTQPFPEAHFAVMPPALAERCVQAGCKPGGVVLDPFCGSGTTGMVAGKHGRRFVGIDLSADYLDLALRTRLAQGALIEEAS